MDPARIAYPVTTYVDPEGRAFPYVFIDHGQSTLGVHFSAFFGEWGNRKENRYAFQGYFHRLRMLGTDTRCNWLFLCDPFGADGNGTYYTGASGDLFVERAMTHLLRVHIANYGERAVVMVGSSMGATAALKFGLLHRVRGVVAISPHIDLDICAALQGRERHVAFALPDGDTQSSNNHVITRQITRTIDAWTAEDGPPPSLFVQCCEDDAGVFEEQVLPLIERWEAAGGHVVLDARPVGGHTSDFATAPLILDVVSCILSNRPILVDVYRAQPFAPVPATVSIGRRVLRRGALLLSHLRRPS